jgi:DNA mismatch endonuclease, patch repair protein
MVDSLTPEQRSERMARIRGANTQPEILLRSCLHASGMRYSLHGKNLPGKPDLVLAKHKAVIFVHGCFWHRHKGCAIATSPKSNSAFWQAKFAGNVARDKRVQRQLRKAGWRIFVVWECQVSTKRRAEASAQRLLRRLLRKSHAVPRRVKA